MRTEARRTSLFDMQHVVRMGAKHLQALQPNYDGSCDDGSP